MSLSVQIPIVADVEGVGKNLQEDAAVPLPFAVKNGSALSVKRVLNPLQMIEYATKNTGKECDLIFFYAETS